MNGARRGLRDKEVVGRTGGEDGTDHVVEPEAGEGGEQRGEAGELEHARDADGHARVDLVRVSVRVSVSVSVSVSVRVR